MTEGGAVCVVCMFLLVSMDSLSYILCCVRVLVYLY